MFVSVVAFIVSQRLASPIRQLTVAADRLSQGNLDIAVAGLDRKDEIGDLARAVDPLGTSVKLAIERAAKTLRGLFGGNVPPLSASSRSSVLLNPGVGR